MTKREYYVVIEEGENGYLIADVPELPGCHTQGKTKEELIANVKEAIELYIEVEGKKPAPEPLPKVVGIEKVRVGV